MPDAAAAGKTVSCRHCHGTASRAANGGPPPGWYSLTVTVPEGYRNDRDSKTYLWVGLFCSAACLTAHGPDLARQEALAREGYAPVIPEPAPAPALRSGTGNPVSRRGRRP